MGATKQEGPSIAVEDASASTSEIEAKVVSCDKIEKQTDETTNKVEMDSSNTEEPEKDGSFWICWGITLVCAFLLGVMVPSFVCNVVDSEGVHRISQLKSNLTMEVNRLTAENARMAQQFEEHSDHCDRVIAQMSAATQQTAQTRPWEEAWPQLKQVLENDYLTLIWGFKSRAPRLSEILEALSNDAHNNSFMQNSLAVRMNFILSGFDLDPIFSRTTYKPHVLEILLGVLSFIPLGLATVAVFIMCFALSIFGLVWNLVQSEVFCTFAASTMVSLIWIWKQKRTVRVPENTVAPQPAEAASSSKE